jgi:GNAT superfamily N-acetyltransferase
MSQDRGERLTFVEAPVDGRDGRRCLEAYFSELKARFPSGFDPDASVSAEPDELIRPGGVFLLVMLEERAVGCGGVKSLGGGVGEIKRMWIDPQERGRGLGRALLTALEDAGRSLDHHLLRLDTSAHLPEAIGLYRKAGYREIADYNRNPYAAHWFEKELR